MKENRKNDNQGEFFDFNEFTLYMIFLILQEKCHYQNGHFQEDRENNIYGEFVKIQEFTLVIIFVIMSQKWQFRR